jgi:magnesium transporter
MVGHSEEGVLVFFGALPVDRAADVAEYVEDSLERASSSLDPDRAARIVAAMNPDDRADVMADLEPEPAAAILSRIALPMRRETQALLAYEPNTAGGLMTTAFVVLPQATRADHALALVRTQAQEKETIYSIYVIDQSNRVVGVVSARTAGGGHGPPAERDHGRQRRGLPPRHGPGGGGPADLALRPAGPARAG